MSKLRLFFALQTPADANVALVADVAPLVALLQGQAAPAENLHATLCFIGEIEAERLDALRAAVAEVRVPKFALRFTALEYWDEPKILCATASDNKVAASFALADALADAALQAGFSPDVKPFRAHLTLARKVTAVRAADVPWPLPLGSPLVVQCDQFVLMSSRREESRSIYSVVESWVLDNGA